MHVVATANDRGAGVGVESQGGAGGRGGHLVRGPDPQPRCRTLLPPTARTYPTSSENGVERYSALD